MILATIDHVSVRRTGQLVLRDISMQLRAGDRILVQGENGAGKSTLLMLLAGRLHPYNNEGQRIYAWDNSSADRFRETRKHIGFVSRDEQLRLQKIHKGSTVAEFLTGHLDGQDFLYRDPLPAEEKTIAALISRFALEHLTARRLGTLSLGEMRLVLIARTDLHQRKLYLLDEIFSSLSPEIAARMEIWIRGLAPAAALVMTGHDRDRLAALDFTATYDVEAGHLKRAAAQAYASTQQPNLPHSAHTPTGDLMPEAGATAGLLIDGQVADYFHDFTQIFADLAFQVKRGDRILLTGENGTGKTTLLRIMHGDFYPAWGKGSLRFLAELAHEHKRELWAQVQFIAAAHFSYYPAEMTVRDVLASRYSGSIYDFPRSLPDDASAVISAFAIAEFLTRPFLHLSEGEKTRVLFARAFLRPAPVYLIDEGFIALSERYFAAAAAYLNNLPVENVVVVAANERIQDLKSRLQFRLTLWRLQQGRLNAGHPASSL